MGAYYNENDPFAAQWLRNLIAAGHIAPGEVDARSIEDVTADDLRGFQQCHFFAGIGVWSKALRDAGWPDDRMVWTGSCPCQPFSAAGKRGGITDERHLWPAFYHLIEERRPPIVFGEQVASKDGLAWLDTVQSDLEASGYAVGATDLCAAGVGAPHIRQRLWFVGVADAVCSRARHDTREGVGAQAAPLGGDGGLSGQRLRLGVEGSPSGLDHHHHQGPQGHAGDDGAAGRQGPKRPASEAGVSGGVGESCGPRAGRDTGAASATQEECGGSGRSDGVVGSDALIAASTVCERPGPTNGHWRDADWLGCRDGKWRPVESGTFPLVNGVPSRVGRLRAYGNAIVAEAAREFIGAVTDALGRS